MILRQWMKSDKHSKDFIEYAYGKVADELKVNVKGKIKIAWPEDAPNE
jgi:hypothetical protein